MDVLVKFITFHLCCQDEGPKRRQLNVSRPNFDIKRLVCYMNNESQAALIAFNVEPDARAYGFLRTLAALIAEGGLFGNNEGNNDIMADDEVTEQVLVLGAREYDPTQYQGDRRSNWLEMEDI
ncbi:hypothetical protein ACJX0J_005818 [Zea mays]